MQQNPSRWLRHILAAAPMLALAQVIAPSEAVAQTANSDLTVTAQVVNYCSVNSTVMDLVSVSCSMDTPLVASPAGNAASASAPDSPTDGKKPNQGGKLCNFLASEELENASFNQFTGDMSPHSAAPQNYYSSFEVCF